MMRYCTAILILIVTLSSFSTGSFKDEQKKYARVRQAYADKEMIVKDLLAKNGIDNINMRIYLRAFKAENKIELWAKNKYDHSYKLIREYDVCQTSGSPGPKRVQGDLQIPEGYYHIDRFNPYSNYYLSLGINYPNRSDKILGVKGRLGGDIFIHGACVTIGCLPITDDKIKELYIFCVEAKDNGQTTIPVTIFPAKMTDTKYNDLKTKYRSDTDKLGLWDDLKLGYDYFNETKTLPSIGFLENGRHNVSK